MVSTIGPYTVAVAVRLWISKASQAAPVACRAAVNQSMARESLVTVLSQTCSHTRTETLCTRPASLTHLPPVIPVPTRPCTTCLLAQILKKRPWREVSKCAHLTIYQRPTESLSGIWGISFSTNTKSRVLLDEVSQIAFHQVGSSHTGTLPIRECALPVYSALARCSDSPLWDL